MGASASASSPKGASSRCHDSTTRIRTSEPVGVGGLTASDAILETHLGPELRASEPDPKAERANHAVVVRVDGEVHTLKVDDVEEPVRFAGAVSWGGIKSKYFLAAILADERPLSAVAITPLAADTTRGADVAVFTSPLDAGRTSYRVFLGPQ